MIIAGVDPGSRTTGYGIIKVEGNRFTCLDFGGITPSGKGSSGSLQERLDFIFTTLSSLFSEFQPDCLAVEEIFYAKNARSALMLGHVRGAILLAAARAGLDLTEVSPLEVKKAVTGYGRADKAQVQVMVQRLLNLKEVPRPYDASDALAIALCCAFGGSRSGTRGKRWKESDLKRILDR